MKDTKYTIPAKHFAGQHYRIYFHKPKGGRAYVHSSLVTLTPFGFEKIMDFQRKRGEYFVYLTGKAVNTNISKAFAEILNQLKTNDDIDADVPLTVNELVA